ncbi:uncharacterized protein LOC132743139 [Ruditapes philippinarum]|uniref:uncharacterized protein LOC132743139 n=1 Tax=Ruditapes philippinarum TaxID=129788 RepID=UPI00295C10C4|nr:uncharacterized protein LOC132743139 [Ruditapes philippinarum]
MAASTHCCMLWFPGGPPLTYLPFPVPDGDKRPGSCPNHEHCGGHFLPPSQVVERLLGGGAVLGGTLHEWCQVRESIADSVLAADKAMEWVTTNLNVSHTNLFKLAAVGLLIPTSTSDCERGFSTLKRVKTTHRASLSPPVLNPILPVGMLGAQIEKVDINSMVKIWHKEKPRRSQL